MNPSERAAASNWAGKAHIYAAWLEWTFTILGLLGGLIGAAAVVMVRAGDQAAGVAETNVLLDLFVPGGIVLGAGVIGYIMGLFASSWYRYVGHTVRALASIDERLEDRPG